MKTKDLQGPLLDFWVAKAIGLTFRYPWCFDGSQVEPQPFLQNWATEQAWGLGRCEPSTDWAQGGPLIEKHGVNLIACSDEDKTWKATWKWVDVNGPTPLIAAMRCVVAKEIGDDVLELPDVKAAA